MRFKSPAKINLFLRILGKRSDHYHEIASLLQAVNLYDELTILPSAQDSFECSNPFLPIDSTNLVLKARDLFRRKTGRNDPLKICLYKKIPHEAGLGGGSGNAATTLFGMNALLSTNIDSAILASWGGELGSDIPFFFSLGTAYCTGRGELMEAVNRNNESFYTLFKPSFGLSTKEVYAHVVKEKVSNYDPRFLLDRFQKGFPSYHNDLEEAAYQISPSLYQIKKAISHYMPQVVLSGSGSALWSVGILKKDNQNHLMSLFPDLKIFTVSSVNRSPYHWYA